MYADINPDSKQPKYKQLVDLIIQDIKLGVYSLMDKLPSINDISAEYEVSRDTVERALKELRKRGIIKSIERKGYFISKVTFDDKINIAFITNRIPDFKRNIYEIFTEILESYAHVDVYVYNYDIKKFETIISGHINDYNYFVVIPFFDSIEDDKKAVSILERVPPGKLILVDRSLRGLTSKHSSFYQDFELDIRKALISLKDQIIKYEKHYLVFPESSRHPKEVIKGFTVFCKMYELDFEILNNSSFEVHKDCTYTILDDYDLVRIIEEIRAKNIEPGNDIGLISYNESPLKQILMGGITVITTDWESMGRQAAEVILNGTTVNNVIPFAVLKRGSL